MRVHRYDELVLMRRSGRNVKISFQKLPKLGKVAAGQQTIDDEPEKLAAV